MLRVTEVIKPLYGSTFDDIPRYILDPAIEFGNAGHAEIEAYLRGERETENSNILYMFKQAADRVGFDPSTARIEERLTSIYTGKPDYFDDVIVADWKFTSQGLRNETALQLVAYSVLCAHAISSRRTSEFAFQFDKDTSLSVYELNEKAWDDVYRLFNFLLDNHAAIEAGGIELYEALAEWDRIQYEHELFELVDIFYPPLTVTDHEKALQATMLYVRLKEVKKEQDRLNVELKRWMLQEGIESIEFEGGKISLQTKNTPQYKIPKEVKEQYRTGTTQSVSLVVRKG